MNPERRRGKRVLAATLMVSTARLLIAYQLDTRLGGIQIAPSPFTRTPELWVIPEVAATGTAGMDNFETSFETGQLNYTFEIGLF